MFLVTSKLTFMKVLHISFRHITRVLCKLILPVCPPQIRKNIWRTTICLVYRGSVVLYAERLIYRGKNPCTPKVNVDFTLVLGLLARLHINCPPLSRLKCTYPTEFLNLVEKILHHENLTASTSLHIIYHTLQHLPHSTTYTTLHIIYHTLQHLPHSIASTTLHIIYHTPHPLLHFTASTTLHNIYHTLQHLPLSTAATTLYIIYHSLQHLPAHSRSHR